MEEIWKEIQGYDNYIVSIVSNAVKVKNRKRGTLKTIYKSSDGHWCVALWKNNKSETIGIHRILALAFIPVPEELKSFPIEELDVHHINFDKDDNSLDNLMWVTHAKHIEIHSNKPIEQLTTDKKLVREWTSASEVERVLGYSQANISKCCNNVKHYNTAYGYIWRFKRSQVS